VNLEKYFEKFLEFKKICEKYETDEEVLDFLHNSNSIHHIRVEDLEQ
jgi:hypothetical protein